MTAGVPPGQTRISERKHYPDGRLQEFDCLLLRRTAGTVAVRFDHIGPAASRYGVPEGSYTVGYFWQDRLYNLYRIRDPAGRGLRDRFDVICDCRITAGAVDYTDLYLDLLIDPSGRMTREDEEELEEALGAGMISAPERDRALRVLEELAAGACRRAIEDAERFWPATRRE